MYSKKDTLISNAFRDAKTMRCDYGRDYVMLITRLPKLKNKKMRSVFLTTWGEKQIRSIDCINLSSITSVLPRSRLESSNQP